MVVDMVNVFLCCNNLSNIYKLDSYEYVVVRTDTHPLYLSLTKLTRNRYLQLRNANPVAYVDVFVDAFMGLYQGTLHRWCHV